MLMKHIIRQGDTLKEYGGAVIDGHYLYFSKGVAVNRVSVSQE
jgi:hypothetical protein